MSYSEVKTVGIIGAGLIGGTWAAYFLSRGLSVRAWGPATNARIRLNQVVNSALADLRSLHGGSTDLTGDLVFCDTLADAVAGSDYIQENGPEKLDLKQSLFAEIYGHAAIQREFLSHIHLTLLICCRLLNSSEEQRHRRPFRTRLLNFSKGSARCQFAYRKKLLVTSQTGWLPLCGARLFILSQKVSPQSKMSTAQFGSDLD